MKEAVAADAALEALEGPGVGQLAVDEQVGDLKEGGGLGELGDRVAAIAQDAGPAVDVGDVRGARGGVGVAGVEGHHPGGAEQPADAQAIGPLGGVYAGQLQVRSPDGERTRDVQVVGIDGRVGHGAS